MRASIRDSVLTLLLLPLVWIASCATGEAPITNETASSSSSGGGGAGGGDLGPCGIDCVQIPTAPCTIAVCNTGQELGPLNTCVVVPSPKGTACDDGKFCTIAESCNEGVCVGGTTNDCGTPKSSCTAVICYEDSKSCDVAPVNDGATCDPADLCMVDGVCQLGACVGGVPKDCAFSPLNECNGVLCNPATGMCAGTPDPDKNNEPCFLTGDVCRVNKTCVAGVCAGGAPRDCSDFDVGCEVGVCDAATGICGPTPAPLGAACSEGIPECAVGACDEKGECAASSAPNGTGCSDHDSCTKADKCSAGSCVGGGAVADCVLYLNEGFEVCPNGWTFGGDWQCGSPTNVGPPAAHTGDGVIATQIAGVYQVNQTFNACAARSPVVDLTKATKPVVSFWAWVHTEGGTFDGWNLRVSTDGGQTFALLTTVTPAYPLTVGGQAAWGGDHSAEGWQNYTADLTAYVGQSILLRFSFRSDAATVFPGVYIDDVIVAEPLQIPLYVTTSSPLDDVYAGKDYATQFTAIGGTGGGVWSIVSGGVNTAWLAIDQASGLLKGTPSAAQEGPVTVTVHVEEPGWPSNFAEKTFTFKVKHDAYYTSFEGACPSGWTLTGDWECGVPVNVGPATAYVGTQCIGTQIAGNYNDLQSFAATTATSPEIDLSAEPNPILTFRMWLDTEGSTYDGVNLQVSTDGINYSVVNGVMPAYPLMIIGQPAWGGHESQLGWQLMQADLSAYAGQVIRLRFSFQSDSSGGFPGVYIDDVFVG